MQDVKVFLIGGAPGAGKTTLGCTLAARLGIACVTVDDLLTVAQTVTTPESHPDLHIMKRAPSHEYFTNSSIAQLKEDANTQHEACWPFVLPVIQKHATWAPHPIVIDGWHLRPARVAALDLENVWSGWIIPSPSVLEERERRNVGWMDRSSDPARMLENFLARSLWFNEQIKAEATEHRMNILPQPGGASVHDLCDLILSR